MSTDPALILDSPGPKEEVSAKFLGPGDRRGLRRQRMDIVVVKITNESLLCFPPPSPKQVSFHFGKPVRVTGIDSKNSSPKARQTGHGKE